MDALLNYADPEELKQLVAVFAGLAQGEVRPGKRVDIPIKTGHVWKNRFVASILRAASDLPQATSREGVREVITHFALGIFESLDGQDAAIIAFHAADALFEEAAFRFATSRSEAVQSFCNALCTQKETELLKSTLKIWK
jgi:hypothetical protein